MVTDTFEGKLYSLDIYTHYIFFITATNAISITDETEQLWYDSSIHNERHGDSPPAERRASRLVKRGNERQLISRHQYDIDLVNIKRLPGSNPINWEAILFSLIIPLHTARYL